MRSAYRQPIPKIKTPGIDLMKMLAIRRQTSHIGEEHVRSYGNMHLKQLEAWEQTQATLIHCYGRYMLSPLENVVVPLSHECATFFDKVTIISANGEFLSTTWYM